MNNGATIEEVQLLLGHADIDDSRRYIDVSKATLRQAFEDVIRPVSIEDMNRAIAEQGASAR